MVRKAMTKHAPMGDHTRNTKGAPLTLSKRENASTAKIKPVTMASGTASGQLTLRVSQARGLQTTMPRGI